MPVCRHRPMRDRLQTVPIGVAASQYREDPWRAFCSRDIDPRDPRMRIPRTEETGIRLTRQIHVVRKASRAGQQPRVLEPPNRLTDPLRSDLLSRSQKRHLSSCRPLALHLGGALWPSGIVEAKTRSKRDEPACE